MRTTLDLKAQTAAEKAITGTLNRKGDPSAALVAVKPGTGEVIAMVGGRDFKTQQFNVAVQGERQTAGLRLQALRPRDSARQRCQPGADLRVRPDRTPRRRQDLECHGCERRKHGADEAEEGHREVRELRLREAHHRHRSRQGRCDGRGHGTAQGHEARSGDRAGRNRDRCHPAGDGDRVRHAGGRRQARDSLRDRRREGRLRAGAVLSPAQDRRGARPRRRVSDHRHPQGRHQRRYGNRRRHRTPRCRQDGHHPGEPGRLVRRLHTATRDGGLDGLPGGADGDVERSRPTGHGRLVPG